MAEPLPQTRPARRAGNLPVALTPLVGRTDEVDYVRTLLDSSRTVCITGPGGAGKTRLVLELARGIEAAAPGRVRWLDLSSRADPGSVSRALADAFGVREAPGTTLLASVAAAVGDADALIVLDNCEHLVPSCAAAITELLGTCPRVRVVATSREVLGVPGEAVWPVPPLATPDDADVPLPELLQYGAVALFVQRARAVRPDLVVDAPTAAVIARICRALDGLPLAIELAAARLRVLSVTEIADALADRLALLTSTSRAATDRHQSLRAVLDWSSRLLPPAERSLLAELSVFGGSFGLDAVRAVHRGEPGEPDLLDLIARLVERSLVTTVHEGGRTRYALMQTVRVYAGEQLDRTGRSEPVRRRFIEWCVGFAEAADVGLAGPEQTVWLDRIQSERGNINTALRLALAPDGDARDATRLAAALWRFCAVRGYYSEGRALLAAALAAGCEPAVPPELRGRALIGAGRLAYLQCEYDEATARFEEALALYRRIEDDRGRAEVLAGLGSVARERGCYDEARDHHEESLVIWRRLGNEDGAARALNYLSLLAWLEERPHESAALAERALAHYRATGDAEGIAGSLINLAACALQQRSLEQAGELLDESLRISRSAGHREGGAWSLELLGLRALLSASTAEAQRLLRDALRDHWQLGDRWRTASVLESLAAADVAEGRRDRAARTLGAAEALRAVIDAPVPPAERARLQATAATVAGAPGQRLGRLAGADAVIAELLRGDGPAEPVLVTDRAPTVSVRALGGSHVDVDGRTLTAADFGYAKPRELLHYLLDVPAATKEQIGVALWPWASASRLRSTFHTTLHHLRAALPGDRIVFRAGRYGFDRTLPYTSDVEEFQTLAAVSGEGAAAALERAAALYGGAYLADLVGEQWIDERRDELQRSYRRVLSELARLRAGEKRWDDAIEVLHKVVADDPLRESAQRDLIRYYAAAGHRGSALRQFRRFRDVLRTELNAAPEESTVDLVARIRRGEPVGS